MIDFVDSAEGIGPHQLAGFFVGWPNPPSPETHLKLLTSSDEIVLAVEAETGNVVGFVTAVGDGVLSAHIPLLEVLPAYQRQGIGRELMRQVLEKLEGLYAIDLLCNPDKQPFYARLGMQPAAAMMIRNYERQSGAA